MAKYDPLRDHLGSRQRDSCELTFAEIEQIMGARLPNEALYTLAWWSNPTETETQHDQAKAWMDVGWRVDTVNMTRLVVRFVRVGNGTG